MVDLAENIAAIRNILSECEERQATFEQTGKPSDFRAWKRKGGVLEVVCVGNIRSFMDALETSEARIMQLEAALAWQPIETAPYDAPVEVWVGHMTMIARLLPNVSENEDGPCDQWSAEYDGEHPPCWSGGGCWASNEDEMPSLQPNAWRAALQKAEAE